MGALYHPRPCARDDVLAFVIKSGVPQRRGSAIFVGCALAFAAGALYHALGIVHPSWAEPSPAWRHAVFVAINALAAWGMLRRPRWFIALFALLVAQQLYGHATYGWEVFRDQHRIDWASVAVVLGMPIVLALLVVNALRRPPEARRTS